MTPDYLTEQQWNDIYDKIFDAVLKAFLKNDRTEEEARDTMEKIKEVFVKDTKFEEQIR